jgi:hypothetical protein
MGKASISILLTTLTVAMTAIAVAPSPALAGGGDVAATRTYIQANYALVHTARGNMKAGEAALESLRRQLGAECPKAAAASPENKAAEQLSNEIVGAMSVVFIRSDARAVADFAHTVGGLHWSDRKLTHKVAAYAAKLEALAALTTPNVCADVKAWASGDYRTLPTSVEQFDRQFKAEDVGIGEVPARLLTPYENPVEHATLERTTRFENELVDAEARAVEPWSKILDALDLQP